MPIPAHKRVQVQGTLQQNTGGGSEIFEFGWASQSDLSLSDLAAALDGVMRAAWTDGTCFVSSFAVLTGIRVEQVAAGGAVTDSFYHAVTPTNGLSDGAFCTVLTAAITLETDTAGAHGRKVRGRFYPPAYPGMVGATFDSGDRDNYVQAWAEIINAANAAGDAVSVASSTGGGQIATVTGLTVDNVIDTQRRRKNHVTNSRSAVHAITA